MGDIWCLLFVFQIIQNRAIFPSPIGSPNVSSAIVYIVPPLAYLLSMLLSTISAFMKGMAGMYFTSPLFFYSVSWVIINFFKTSLDALL
jgi:positive regulator of sigma E activity